MQYIYIHTHLRAAALTGTHVTCCIFLFFWKAAVRVLPRRNGSTLNPWNAEAAGMYASSPAIRPAIRARPLIFPDLFKVSQGNLTQKNGER
jgi:hypothetical protein